MQHFQNDRIQWLQFDLLSDIPQIRHAIFLRHGGYSEGPYKSLNLGLQIGDDPSHVQANLELIEKQLQREIPAWKKLVWGWGCHKDFIEEVDMNSPQIIPECDGIISHIPNITLMMKHADCQVALIYDPVLHVIGNVHAGWRGSVLNIYAKAIEKMKGRYGSNPADLLVCISPSLGPDEAEFMHYHHELPEDFWKFQVRPTYFDFWAISEYQLQAAGILPHHIEIARLSTYSNSYDYFSYRRDKITGRHATCITLL
jgi:hypothetical protein